MKSWIFIIILYLCFIGQSLATTYYCDPINGSMNNDGSKLNPWSSLREVFTRKKVFQGGDTIRLRTGNHGYALISGEQKSHVVIMPDDDASPIIERIRITTTNNQKTGYWHLEGLKIMSESQNGMPHHDYYILEIYPDVHNIILNNLVVTSADNTTNWTRTDWRNRCNGGIFTRAGLNSKIAITNCTIKNVTFGLILAASDCIATNNVVQNFTNDASRVLGSRIIFTNNRIFDLIKVMTNEENHDDLFQSFTSANPGSDTLKDCIIARNLFINTTSTNRSFVGACQGIGCFDGPYLRWSIENNIVITDHWHGISMYGAIDCQIKNNIAIDPYPVTPIDSIDQNNSNIGPTWIRIDKKANGPASAGNKVFNNIAQNQIIIAEPSMGTKYNNLIIGDIRNYNQFFINVDNISIPLSFDLHYVETSPAVDAGTDIDAPLSDFDGTLRPQGKQTDIGAYEYIPNTKIKDITDTNSEIIIFPNPMSNYFFITIPKNNIKVIAVSIIEINGQIIFHKILPLGETDSFITIRPEINPGNYVVILETDKGIVTKQLIRL